MPNSPKLRNAKKRKQAFKPGLRRKRTGRKEQKCDSGENQGFLGDSGGSAKGTDSWESDSFGVSSVSSFLKKLRM